MLLLAVAITVGTVFFRRMEQADAQIASLTQRVVQTESEARNAAIRAEISSKAAEEARLQAGEATGARRVAEMDKQQAEMDKQEAEARAKQAILDAGIAREEMQRVRQEREAEMDRMQKALDRIVETRRTAFGMVMNLPESALRFEFNSAELRPEGREVLSRIAGILLTSGEFGLGVHGHTDDVGSQEYNLRLSERRAEAVKDYLREAGIDPAIVTTKGHGKSSPVAKGNDDASRAKNRRVEIALTDTKIQYRGEAVNN